MNKRTNDYEQRTIASIEKLVLAADVSFGVPSKAVLGKFHMPLMTPTSDMSKAVANTNGKYKTSNYIQIYIPPHILWGFTKPTTVALSKTATATPSKSTVYALSIPTKTTIKAGTVFLGEYIGGDKNLKLLRIVGVSIDSIDDEE